MAFRRFSTEDVMAVISAPEVSALTLSVRTESMKLVFLALSCVAFATQVKNSIKCMI